MQATATLGWFDRWLDCVHDLGSVPSWGTRPVAANGQPVRTMHYVAAALPGMGVVESVMSPSREAAAWAWLLANSTPPEDCPADFD